MKLIWTIFLLFVFLNPCKAQGIMHVYLSDGTILNIDLGTIDSTNFADLGVWTIPTLDSVQTANLTFNSINIYSSVLDNGSIPILQKGFCWGINPVPNLSDNVVYSNDDPSFFSSILNNLSSLTTYYVRSFATNLIGTSYGPQISFSTPTFLDSVVVLNVSSVDAQLSHTINVENIDIESNGIVWSTQSNPTIDDMSLVLGTGNGNYNGTISIDFLQEYYIRAFAIVNGIYYYGPISQFIADFPIWLNADLTYGVVQDFEGNKYPTIQIGSQTWMATNLRSSYYNNGDPIPYVDNGLNWTYSTITAGACAYYNNDPSLNNTYGKLYSFYTIQDPRGLCPIGWHVATLNDWNNLASLYPITTHNKTSTSHWSLQGSNISGFSALPAGTLNQLGSFSTTFTTTFWLNTNAGSVNLFYYGRIIQNIVDINTNSAVRPNGYSIRCVMD